MISCLIPANPFFDKLVIKYFFLFYVSSMLIRLFKTLKALI